MRCLIYNKDGANAREVKVDMQGVTWGSGEITETAVNIPITEPKLDADLIKQGNLVLLEDENLLPWGGVIEPPFSWNDQSVSVAVQSPEFYFSGRHTVQEFSSSATVGSVILKMLRQANNIAPMPFIIKKENIDTDGTLGGEAGLENGTNVYDALAQMAEDNNVVWWLETVKVKGSPRFEFFAQKERASNGAPIEIGANGNAAWGSAGIVESGRGVSSYLAKTSDSQYATGKTSRFILPALLDKYGFFEQRVDVETIPAGGGRPKEVKAEIKKNKLVRGFHILAYLGELTKSMHPGSIHLLNASKLGFSGGQRGTKTTVQIDQMLYNDTNGTLEIVAFEV